MTDLPVCCAVHCNGQIRIAKYLPDYAWYSVFSPDGQL